jgi:hypothetical protein
MSIRFFKRVRIAPGIRVNLSRSTPSISFGKKGAWFTTSARGKRVTAGLPGSGLWATEFRSWKQSPRSGARPWTMGGVVFAAAGLIAALYVVGMLLFH